MTFLLLFLALAIFAFAFRPTSPAAMMALQMKCARDAEKARKLAR